MAESGFSLLRQGWEDTSTLRQGDHGLPVGANDKGVGHASREGVSSGILDVGDFVRAGVVLDGDHSAHTTNVVSSSDKHSHVVLEFNDAFNFTGGQVKLQKNAY